MSGTPVHIHLDAVGGIAGDMFAGAMVHALPHLRDPMLADCAAVLPAGTTPKLVEAQNGSLSGLRLALPDAPPTGDTHYRALRQRIANAPLSTATIKHAHAILHALAAAEASVHGVAIENVHFHELADWDSLMDVVAAGSILGRCAGATFSLSPLPLGSGMVKTQHGRMPVPAPATTILLAGQTVIDDGVPGERVTPTGAAIVSVLPRAPMPLGTVGGQGFGAGTRTLPGIANVLRALVIEPTAQPSFTGDSVAEIAFEVDDMTGEEIAEAATRLRDIAGVVDVTVGSRTGKHGRPVSDFRILTTPAAQAQTAAAVFDQTATIGLRTTQTQRIKLPRADGAVPIDGTPVPAKTVDRPAGPTRKAEARAVTGDTLQERRKLRRAVEDAPC